ncbi:CHAT domain-containing protein [Roseateles sp.]|uniref:CHAT domain-containing protein n=1 Tax=Roseateles sp. TaxID=1971397 RepID=UPI003264101A
MPASSAWFSVCCRTVLAGLAFAGLVAGQASAQTLRLPLAVAASGTQALPTLLRASLLEYQELLPPLRRMRWGGMTETGVNEQVWNPATTKFLAACRAQAADCQPLLTAQLQTMDRAVRELPAESSARAAVMLSVIADFCGSFPDSSQRPFGVCQLSNRLYDAAKRWQEEGQEYLFLHYLSAYDFMRGQYRAWLKNEGQVESASTAAALPEVAPWISAEKAELDGYLNSARQGWMAALGLAAQHPASALGRISALQIARLSWRLGDVDIAEDFERTYAELRGEGATGCADHSLRWRTDIARDRALRKVPADSPARLRSLVTQQCGYSAPVLDLVNDALLRPDGPSAEDRAVLRTVLDEAVRACSPERCSTFRAPQLRALQALLGGSPVALRALLKERIDGNDLDGLRPESELRVDWAVAATLLREPALQEPSLALLRQVQGLVLLRTNATRLPSFSEQRDLARFDSLHRLAARASVEQGQPLLPSVTEGLRAQTLLRRLRAQSLADQFKGLRDADADARRQQQRADAQRLRTLAVQLPKGVKRLFESSADEGDAMAELAYLEALAVLRLSASDRDRQWLNNAAGKGPLQMLEMRKIGVGAREGDSLSPGDAYLSWLEVPGGFVATLLLKLAPDEAPRLSNHFVALGVEQRNALQLYRKLLFSGDAAAQEEGLSLRGRPIWRTADGRYVAAAEAPDGARRVADLATLGREVSGWLLAPLPVAMREASRLFVSPDGVLTQLPFEALWLGDRQLVAQMDVGYVQSLAVHAELSRRAARPRTTAPRLLSIADPVYRAIAPGEGALPDWMADLEWTPLPGTRKESAALLPLFAKGSRQLLGQAASRAALLDLQSRDELAGFDVLHFATHGYVDDQRSALVLSMGTNLPQAYLQDGDIAALTLRSDLVLLSACETGLGRAESGEGVMGLPYAFMLAGNTNTLMTLWPIDDEGTSVFMPAFLAKVRQGGMDVIAALTATKREFAAGRHGDALRDPRIWAAFVQYGVPLKLQR